MKRSYSIDANRVIIDYSTVYCETMHALLKSQPFEHVVNRYLEKLSNRNAPQYQYFKASYSASEEIRIYKDLVKILRLLTSHQAQEIAEINESYGQLLRDPHTVYEFVEGLYDYWRTFERYIVFSAPKNLLRAGDSIHSASFIRANETLKNLILRTYRTICENLISEPFRVFRQLPAGAHLGLLLQNVKWNCPENYQFLAQIPFIRMALLEPPVIFYPRMNKRSGLFKEVLQNPVEYADIQPESWFCYPAKIGNLLAFAYFHKDYMCQGSSLANLFELASYEDIHEKRPDIILIFGANSVHFTDDLTMFHHDKQNHLMVGYEVNSETIDYFGYMKKMLLTLHNIIQIERGLLPVHGAMVSIQLKNKASANVVIIGDSGAGKSETLEAFRILAQDYISEMQIIFDDMGSLQIEDGEFKAFGTEIGAFLRLDDLQPGYAFEQIDRSIFMNPNLTNARVILPVTKYRQITQGCPVNYILYANNYEKIDENNPAVELFSNWQDALATFSAGKRIAKGTTTETGLVESYFANPFGGPQRRKAHEELAEKFIKQMFKNEIAVGQIRTQLGLEGYEQEGPQIAAKALFETMSDRLKK